MNNLFKDKSSEEAKVFYKTVENNEQFALQGEEYRIEKFNTNSNGQQVSENEMSLIVSPPPLIETQRKLSQLSFYTVWQGNDSYASFDYSLSGGKRIDLLKRFLEILDQEVILDANKLLGTDYIGIGFSQTLHANFEFALQTGRYRIEKVNRNNYQEEISNEEMILILSPVPPDNKAQRLTLILGFAECTGNEGLKCYYYSLVNTERLGILKRFVQILNEPE